MLRKIILAKLLLCNFVLCSNNIEDDSLFIRRNSLDIELLGSNASLLTIHYARLIKKIKLSGLTMSLGFSYLPSFNSQFNPIISVPVSINLINRVNKKNHLEFGLGVAYSSGLIQEKLAYTDHGKSLEALFLTSRVGYRFQKPNGKFFFSAAFTPIVKMVTFSRIQAQSDFFLPFCGIGLGYLF